MNHFFRCYGEEIIFFYFCKENYWREWRKGRSWKQGEIWFESHHNLSGMNYVCQRLEPIKLLHKMGWVVRGLDLIPTCFSTWKSRERGLLDHQNGPDPKWFEIMWRQEGKLGGGSLSENTGWIQPKCSILSCGLQINKSSSVHILFLLISHFHFKFDYCVFSIWILLRFCLICQIL